VSKRLDLVLGGAALVVLVAIVVLTGGHAPASAPAHAVAVHATPALRPPTPRVLPQPAPDAMAGLWTAAGVTWLGLLVALPVLLVLALGGAAISWGWRRHTRVGPPHLEVPLKDRELAHRVFDVELTRAASTWPEHYAPHYAPRLTVSGTQPGPPAAAAVSAPNLRDVLSAPGLVLGLPDDDLGREPVVIEGEWTSVGVGGRPGSGKSNTVASLVAQHVLRGGEVLLGDPHAGARRSLARRLEPLRGHLEVVSEPRAILGLVEHAHDELGRRKRLCALGAAREWRPLAVVIDEWTSLMRGELADPLARRLGELVSEGQKYAVTAILAAQTWTAATVGGSFVRNPMPTAVVHRTRPEEARVLTGLRGEAVPADVLNLPPGVAYVVGTPEGVRRVRVPRVEPEEVVGLLRASSDPRPTRVRIRDEGAMTPGLDAPRTRSGRASDAAPEVLALFRQGRGIAEIVGAVYGVRPGGRAYQEAKEQVEAVIRRAITAEGAS